MNVFRKTIIVLVLFVFFASVSAIAADKGNFSTTPKTNNGKKWRIGYYEGGEYVNYQQIFIATVKGLMNLGWIDTAEIPQQQGEQTKELWNWLSNQTKSKYIEFAKDAHYSANWDKELRKKMTGEIIERLNKKKDIDLMLAFGTWAGQDLANDNHKTPTMVISVSDPLKAGIIKSLDDSGFEHIHARIDPFRYERQIRLFHNIVNFKKLGVAYENTDTGRTYGAIDKVEKVAQDLGFEIIRCYAKADIPDIKIAEEGVKKCLHELGKTADAIYVTLHTGINKKSISELVKIVNFYKIPTFSQAGSEEVKYGFLMSLSRSGFKPLGGFHAKVIANVFNGAKPRQLEMRFEELPKIAINYKTAEIIEYDLPMEFLETVDEVYNEIVVPE